MVKELYTIIKQHESMGDFTHAHITDEMLDEAEKRMNVKFPEEYRQFLREFGHGGIGGIEVLGVGKNGSLLFEKVTLEYRAYGLPQELFVIENCGEWQYCINSDNGKVVMWSRGDFEYSEAYDDFEAYLYDRVNDMIESMQQNMPKYCFFVCA